MEKLTAKQKYLVISSILILSIGISAYMQSIGFETVYTHLFYVPIILSCIWWKKRGIIVAAFLGLAIILIHLTIRPDAPVIEDIFRGIIFILIAFFVSRVSISEEMKSDLLEKEIEIVKEKSKEMEDKKIELENSHRVLLEKNTELEKWYKLTVGREVKMAEMKKQIKEQA